MGSDLWRRAALPALALGLTVLSLLAAASAAAAPPTFDGPLTTDGRLFRDPQGRVVVMHGLFAVWKQQPLFPAGADDAGNPQIPSFTDDDADLMRDMGFDATRLAWFWEGLEPTEGTYDTTYRDGMLAVEDKLAARGIYTVLDSHQDQYDRIFGDKPGFPEWTAHADGLPTAPPSSDPGYAQWKFPLGYLQAGTQRAFANLYANTDDLWAKYGAAWKYMAQAFDHSPMVIGYDLMNEPWPSQLPSASPQYDTTSCFDAGCPAWDQNVLEPLMTSLARSIRQVDTHRPVFYEPSIEFNSGKPNGFVAPPADVAPVALSFHNQCSTRAAYSITKDPALIESGHTTCPPEEAKTMHNADATAATLGGPPLMTEVAPTADADSQGLNCLLERADYFQTGFTYGLSWSNPNKELRRLHAESAPGAKQAFKEQVLARVYPRAIAGDPVSYSFDVRTGKFDLTYRTRAGTTGPTVITVPTAIQYPSGYDVAVTGGTVTSAVGADLVTVDNSPGATTVTVEIKPSAGDTTVRPSFPPCVLDPKSDDTPPADPLLLRSFGIAGRHDRSAIRHHLRVRAICERDCDLRVRIGIGRAVARAFDLRDPGRGLIVARGHGSGDGGKPTVVKVRFNSKSREALATGKFHANLLVTASEDGAAGVTSGSRVTLGTGRLRP